MREDQKDDGHHERVGVGDLEELRGRLRKDHDVAALAPAIERGDRRRRHADPSDLEPELRRESDGGQHQEAAVDEAQAPWRTLE